MTLRANIIANYVGQIWSVLMGLAFLPLYVRYLGAEAYGLIGFYALLQSWLSILELGMGPMLNREMARYAGGAITLVEIRNLLRSAETLCWSIGGALTLAVWLAAEWLATGWLNVETLPRSTAVAAVSLMAPVIGLRFCEGIYRSALLGLQRQVWYNLVLVVSTTLRWGGAAAFIVFASASITEFFIWQAVVSLLTIAALAFGAHASLPRAKAQFSLTALQGVWRFAGGMLLISLVSLLLLQLDKLIVSRLLPLSDFAIYSLAAMAGGALSFVAGPVSQAYYPRLTQAVASGDQAATAAAYQQSSQLLAMLTIPPAMVLAFFSREVLLVWTGDPALSRAASLLLSAFALGAMFNGLMSMPYMLQLAHGWTRLSALVNAATLVVMAPLLWLATTYFGARGAALAWLGVFALYGHVSLNIMHRRLLPAERKPWYLHAWSLPLASGAAVVGAASQAMPHIDARWLIAVLLAMTGGAALFAVALATPLGRAALRRLVR